MKITTQQSNHEASRSSGKMDHALPDVLPQSLLQDIQSNSCEVIIRLARYDFALKFWASTSTCPESSSLLCLVTCQLHLAPDGSSWANLVTCYLVDAVDIGSGPKKQGRRGLEDGMEELPSGSVGLPNPDMAQSLTRLPNAP